jgi:methionine sulfoxide reductase heme-binding subunit
VSHALWYLVRGTGVVTLLLLTGTTVLGIAGAVRLGGRGVPRFVVQALHRSVAGLALAFLGVHVATTLIDGYAPIRVADAVLPFSSAYHPLGVGLGALALDLLAAVAVTSAFRGRVGHRAWRALHWLAYLAWPVALAHALTTGTDAGRTWMTGLAVACVALVGAAAAARLVAARPGRAAPRLGATTLGGTP